MLTSNFCTSFYSYHKQVTIIGPETTLSSRVPSTGQISNFQSLTNLQLTPGHYNISIVAVNTLKMESDAVWSDIYILVDKPHRSMLKGVV